MKGVFVILDGAADEPCRQLNDKTPLEAANTPNLNEIASKSKIEHCYTVKKGVAPESSSAVLSLLGYNPDASPRGILEAIGAGVRIKNGDLVLRTNFATVDNIKDGNILDPRAGRTLTTKEARILASAINDNIKLPFKFEFYPTVQHRGVVVFKGNFSDNISGINPFYGNGNALHQAKPKILESKPLDDEDESKLSSNLVNSFVRHSFEVLDKHPLNIMRAKKGLYSANILLCRGPGSEIPKLKKLKGKWMALSYMPLEKGIARVAGMDTYSFKYPKTKGIDTYSSLYYGLRLAIRYSIRMIKKYRKKYDYFYIHFKETDLPGHDNKPFDKVKMIELIDKEFFSYILKYLGNINFVVTCDHTTSCKKKAHTEDPVPVLVYTGDKSNAIQRFTELDGLKGRLVSPKRLLEHNLFSKK